MDILSLRCLLDIQKEMASKQLDNRIGSPYWECTFGGCQCKNGVRKMSVDCSLPCSIVLALAGLSPALNLEKAEMARDFLLCNQD